MRLPEADAGVEVVASCEDMDGLLDAVAAESTDVVLTDIRMPPGGDDAGIRVATQLRETRPDTGVVVLSQYPDPGFVLRLFAEGSDRRVCLLKERVAGRGQLVAAMRAVANGGSRRECSRSTVIRATWR